jgi:hypothetical protein
MPRHHAGHFLFLEEKPVAEKRFQVYGWTRRGAKPKESDGVTYDLGQYDLQKDAEAVKREHLRVGWGSVAIIDREAPAVPLR